MLAIALASVATPAAAQTEEQQVQAAQTAEACDDLAGAERDACLSALGTAPPPGDAQEEGSIVVTGSRIPRANFDSAQPTVVLGSEQIETRGYTNIADALQELPAFGVPGSSPVGAGQGGAIGSGQSFVNFFGLGDQRTLTTVNGRRFVSSNTASIFGPSAGGPGGQVDFNVIPTVIVDRVETIAIGGAPIYGSDAIAGTVNVITKRTFEGFQLDGQASISERGDAHDYRIRGAIGTNFAEGRGNIMIAAEYNETGGLDFESRPGSGLNRFFTIPADPDAPFENELFNDRRIPSISENGIPSVTNFIVLSPTNAGAFGIQAGITDNPADPLNGNPLMFAPNGSLVPIDFGSRESGDLITSEGGSGFALPGNLLSPTRRYIGVALAQFQVTDNIRLFGEGWYANSKGTQFRAQPEYNLYLFGQPPGAPGGNFVVSVDNPFLDPAARELIIANLAANPFSDSQDTFQVQRANTDLTSGLASSTIELWRVVGGLDGTFGAFGREMTFELVGNYGKSTSEGNGRQIVHQNLLNALNSVRDSSGNIVCAPGAVNAAVATVSSTCAPLNPFGRNISQAARDYVTAITDPRSVNDQWVVTTSVSGPLFDLPGGAVKFAVGYEHRKETTEFDPGAYLGGGPDPDPTTDTNGDGDPANDRVQFGQNALIDPVSGRFNTDEVFGELTIPILGPDNDIPAVHSLELHGAIRYIDHSLSGADPTYTVDLTYQPIRDITFRGNYTRSVRSPAITEFFNPRSQIFTTANDPCDSRFIDGGPNPSVRAANCAADGLPADFNSNIVNFTSTGVLSGNAGLINETADAWTVGAVLRPRFVPNLTLAVDWVDIQVDNAVQPLTATNVLQACYDSPDFPNVISASGTNFCNLITRDDDGQVTFIETNFENAAQLNFEGLLAELAYRIDTPFLGERSSLSLGVNYLYNHKNTLRVGAADITTLDDSIGYSKHQATTNLTYKNEGFAMQWQFEYIGETLNDPDQPLEAFEFPEVDDLLLVNLSLSYEIARDFRFSIVVDNLFDTNQPFPVPGNGGSVTYFDAIRGRYFRIGAGFKF
jgi:outer membrane receptor protein involved in Fe transport